MTIFAAFAGAFIGVSHFVYGGELAFDLPIDCEIGKTCFLQNMIDLDQKSDGFVDTLCGDDGYNGHKGIDIRVITLDDVTKNIPILAIQDGVVKGVRNTMEDRLITGGRKPQYIQGRECGNGLVLDHGKGMSSQYCHMKKGSLRLKVGDRVLRGAHLGNMGLSGFSAFPHVHLSLRQNGQLIDPLSGKIAKKASCSAEIVEKTPFGPALTKALLESRDDIISIGLTDRRIDFQALKRTGKMPLPTLNSNALVVWGWAINLEAGDVMRLKIYKDGVPVFMREEMPLDRRKAERFNFAGRKFSVEKGLYKAQVEILREGKILEEKSSLYNIQ